MREQAQITRLLKDWGDGDAGAFDEIMTHVYHELRRQASRHLRNERPGHTLQTTALIHEAYFRLVGHDRIEWQNRRHFFAIASTAMRRILVDHARERNREKRGGPAVDLPLDDALQVPSKERSVDLEMLDQALGRLAKLDPRQAKVVELRYFAGMTVDETAEVLGVANSTVRLDWDLAKAWLKKEMTK